ncbi:WD40 repeat domain-containing protein [Streptomyces sp. NPDC051815]|uniref:WD40 repeat domain-containing protein n=1 Tax=Streptomyces sp. NPDC051815 TaxID=3365674 RepID=UPI003790FFA5
MTDIADEAGTDTFEARLLHQARHLRRLKVERGDPSLRRIEMRAQRIGNGAALPIATQNAAFNGKRFVSVDRVILLVRTLMSWDTNGEEVTAPDRTDPVLDEWRTRWRATAELRPARRSPAAAEAPEPEPVFGAPKAETALEGPDQEAAVEASGLFCRGSHALSPEDHPIFVTLLSAQASTIPRAITLEGLKPSLAIQAVVHAMEVGEVSLPPLSTGLVCDVAFSPDGTRFATAGRDRTLRLWDSVTRAPSGEPFTGHTGPVLGVAFSPDGALLATASSDHMVRLWNPDTGLPAHPPLTGHDNQVLDVAFSPDGALLASTSDDHTVRLWNPATGTPAGQPLTGHSARVFKAVFSPGGSLLATAATGETVRLWEPPTGSPVGRPLVGHNSEILDVAILPDDTVLTISNDHRVRLWNPRTGTHVSNPLVGHKGEVRGVAFSSRGTLLAVIGSDHTVRLWNPLTGLPVGQPLPAHSGQPLGMAFSPDNTLLAIAAPNATADSALLHLQIVPGVSPAEETLSGAVHSVRVV